MKMNPRGGRFVVAVASMGLALPAAAGVVVACGGNTGNGSSGAPTPRVSSIGNATATHAIQMFYHETFTDGAYVFDPRMSAAPIPKGDWVKVMRTINPGVIIK